MAWAVRIVVLLLLVEALVLTGRADLFHPSDIGTDSANYAAGGQRVAGGHPLYALSPADQPVPADNAPLWSVPLLSPPGVAVIWAVPAVLGASALAIDAWWLGGAIVTLGWASWVILRGRIGALVLAALLVPMTALTVLSGISQCLPGSAAGGDLVPDSRRRITPATGAGWRPRRARRLD